MIVYRIESGILINNDGKYYIFSDLNWDQFINDDGLFQKCKQCCVAEHQVENSDTVPNFKLLKPIANQEIWASGVTYYNSKMARQEESEVAGGADFYAKVYTAERPELFFKSTGSRAVGHMDKLAIRKDSTWNVPEPELTLCISSSGKIIGYTIGNDMSSRSIEGENPLYLPQAKTYDRSAAIGPGIFVTDEPFPFDAEVSIKIKRAGEMVFEGQTQINKIVRKFEDLVAYLYRETSFPNGCFLMTGTGIVPGSDFTLAQDDEVIIEIEHIGTLVNWVG